MKDIDKYPHVQASLRALMEAFGQDGVHVVGLVVCAAPSGSLKNAIIMTALAENVKAVHKDTGEAAPPLAMLLDQAARGIEIMSKKTSS